MHSIDGNPMQPDGDVSGSLLVGLCHTCTKWVEHGGRTEAESVAEHAPAETRGETIDCARELCTVRLLLLPRLLHEVVQRDALLEQHRLLIRLGRTAIRSAGRHGCEI